VEGGQKRRGAAGEAGCGRRKEKSLLPQGEFPDCAPLEGADSGRILEIPLHKKIRVSRPAGFLLESADLRLPSPAAGAWASAA